MVQAFRTLQGGDEMRLIDAENIRIKPEFMHDVCGMAMIRVEDIVRILNEQPTIKPKRGKWILDRSGAYCCSECMEPCATYVMMKPRDKFCKMCGSKNEASDGND